MMEASVRTYVINLDGGAERLESVSRMLASFGMDFERVPAFDGRKLDLSAVEDYDAGRAESYMGRSLVGAEVGCYRSHLAAAARFLQSDARYGLVFEDDVLLRCNPITLLEEAIPALENVDRDWLLLNIGANKSKITTSIADHDIDGYQCSLVAAHYFPMMACAIVWSREGARQFVENHGKIFAPVDNYFRYWLTRAGHGYALWPAPVTTTDAESQIAASDGRKRSKYGRKWYYGFSKQKRLLEDKLIALGRRCRFKAKAW
ncbi:glycosyltransferase family 25 protein [Aquamicrobium ahrensii]|uniref:Glycosyl transferase family 25 n=1 Tax=Aquamicrobium ahrensii TaxID=469551 RepID=A0ABV2KIS0_9HYPH